MKVSSSVTKVETLCCLRGTATLLWMCLTILWKSAFCVLGLLFLLKWRARLLLTFCALFVPHGLLSCGLIELVNNLIMLRLLNGIVVVWVHV